jgi:tetratricopeptide (TPR) repeat protein/2-polyprenyl-3-methyl-5-hydroxy-6-metoxy-1,4-benzoquinol methylase
LVESEFMKKIPVNFLEPSQQQLNSLLKYYQAGRYVEAEKLSLSITQEFPKHPFAWKVLAVVLKLTGRINESLIISQKSVELNPLDSEAHYNLGVILKGLDRLNEAEVSYRQAITLKPDYAEAHYNLGVMLQEHGRLNEAEASYTQAITLKPDYAEAHNNLGSILQEQGKLKEACSAYIQAINLNPDFTDAYRNFGIAINNVGFNSSNVKLYPLLIRLLSTGNFARPVDLAPSILSLLKHDPLIKNLLLEKNFATSLKEANSIIGSLDKLTLLHHLMRICPLPDLQFERFFVTMRSLLLTNLDNIETSPELIYFLSTLSLHCFTNEHVYVEKDEETELIKNLETEIMQTILKSEQPEAKKILCLASYRSLHQYNWCQRLEALDNLEEVKLRLIEEPYAERAIAVEIPMLGEILNDVSLKVRAQYEENPYPRWVKTGIAIKAKSISEICTELNLHLHSKSIKNVTTPAILIAGCGTGQHSIGTASHFSGCQVTAVDLSLASLSYAKRKTAELGITNLKYLQADILRLDQLEQKFDIIESVGVLHHMDEPMAGWRVLTNLLKPSGLIKIGLYSELARQNIAVIRKEIALLRVGTSESEIREFRRSLTESNDENHQLLTKSSDFFNLSSLRDLIFHVQEYRFTLPQIKKCLDELGLKFCGFINKDVISNFRKLHGEEADIYDLTLWHQFEESNPKTFGNMYQFWSQKL